MIKYQLPHTQFDQISDHKHDTNTCMGVIYKATGAQAANKIPEAAVRRFFRYS